MNKERILYIITTILLLVIETLIALYVRDDFIRPYFGDVLVVIVIYTFIRIFIPEKVRWLPIYIFIFATFVEFMQLIGIVNILGLERNSFWSILIGTSFDVRDILCYATGCAVLVIYEHFKRRA